jgi:hypothetical protein
MIICETVEAYAYIGVATFANEALHAGVVVANTAAPERATGVHVLLNPVNEQVPVAPWKDVATAAPAFV